MMKKIIITFLVFPFFMNAQVSIPDMNFENELISQGIDTDGIVNGQISIIDAEAKTGTLNLDNKGISNLTGIEAFINIVQLRFDDNNVSSFDISALTGLTQIRCANNSLTAIDVSNNTGLTIMEIQNNLIETIDLSANTALSILRCNNNNLMSLNVSNNMLLSNLRCNVNNIASLDLSLNTILTELRCQNNNLSVLNVKNGNNTSIITFNANNNSSLSCIEVDEVAYADANFTKDATAVFSIDCSTLSTNNFNTESFKAYPSPTDSVLNLLVPKTTIVSQISILDLHGCVVLQERFKTLLNIESLDSGVYFIKLNSINGDLIKRIIKQ